MPSESETGILGMVFIDEAQQTHLPTGWDISSLPKCGMVVKLEVHDPAMHVGALASALQRCFVPPSACLKTT